MPFNVVARRKTPVLQGQTPIAKNWEERMRAIPRAENLREVMRKLSAEPHHLGSLADRRGAPCIERFLRRVDSRFSICRA